MKTTILKAESFKKKNIQSCENAQMQTEAGAEALRAAQRCFQLPRPS